MNRAKKRENLNKQFMQKCLKTLQLFSEYEDSFFKAENEYSNQDKIYRYKNFKIGCMKQSLLCIWDFDLHESTIPEYLIKIFNGIIKRYHLSKEHLLYKDPTTRAFFTQKSIDEMAQQDKEITRMLEKNKRNNSAKFNKFPNKPVNINKRTEGELSIYWGEGYIQDEYFYATPVKALKALHAPTSHRGSIVRQFHMILTSCLHICRQSNNIGCITIASPIAELLTHNMITCNPTSTDYELSLTFEKDKPVIKAITFIDELVTILEERMGDNNPKIKSIECIKIDPTNMLKDTESKLPITFIIGNQDLAKIEITPHSNTKFYSFDLLK